MLRFFKRNKPKNSAAIAKERLQIIVAHERSHQNNASPDFLADLQKDILEVVRKYIAIEGDQIKVNVDKEGAFEVLELNIVLSEENALTNDSGSKQE